MEMELYRLHTPNHSRELRLNAESGFTLVELAIVMIIFGVIISAAASIALPMIRTANIVGTQAKLDKIAKAIDFYATQNYRVPCPAAPLAGTTNPPFGYERNSGTDGSTVPTTCGAAANKFGIVPFKTLGIPRDWVIDAWGNYITYAISPAFSVDTTVDFPVHSRCRTAEWYNSAMTYEADTPNFSVAPISVHLSPRKARFCCPYPPAYDPTTDLIIRDSSDISQLTIDRSSPGAKASTSISWPFPMVVNSYPPNDSRPTAPVYVLVSHGANQHGAYNVNTGLRSSTAAATAYESRNASDNSGAGQSIFYEIPKINRSGAERNFDDVIVWRTQDLIMASQGKSCAGP